MMLDESNVSVTGCRVFVCALLSARVKNPRSILDAVVIQLEREGAFIVGRMLQRRGVSRSRLPGGAAKMDKPLTQRGLFSRGKLKEWAAMTKSSRAEILIIHNAITNGQWPMASVTFWQIFLDVVFTLSVSHSHDPLTRPEILQFELGTVVRNPDNIESAVA
jgi:hypothetical protein